MAIHRIKKERDFVILDNAMLREPNLSLKAKGLLAFILSRPDDWVFTIRGLAHFCRDGPDSVRSAVQELENAGYIVRQRRREKGKYQEMGYDIYEKPVQVLPSQVKPEREKPLEEKGAIPNIDPLSIELLNNDYTNYPSTDPREMERLIRKQIEYDIMSQRYDRGQLDNLVSVMTEVMICTTETIHVSRDKAYPAEYMQNCIGKVGPLHIEQIMEYLIVNRPEIRNIRGYVLAALINAANTLDMDCQYGVEYSL